MVQSETERQFYLAMAGVRLWYARDTLHGAAPSPDYVFPEAGAYVASPEGVTRGTPLPVHPVVVDYPVSPGRGNGGAIAKPDLKALMAKHPELQPLPQPEAREVGQSHVVDDATYNASAVEPVSVNLSVQVWIGQRFVVVARLTSEVSARLQETLALNILRSLNETNPQTLGAIHWPVFNNGLVRGNSAADFGSVLGYAISALDDQTLLTLGIDGEIIRAAFGVGQSLDNCRRISFPHSLAEIAANSSFKRDLWHQIKPVTVG